MSTEPCTAISCYRQRRLAGAWLLILNILSLLHVDLLLSMVHSGVGVCFEDNLLNCARCTASNCRIILCDGLGMMRREVVVACSKLISQCLYVVT